MCPSPSHTQQEKLVTREDIVEREESGTPRPQWLRLERVEDWTLEIRERQEKAMRRADARPVGELQARLWWEGESRPAGQVGSCGYCF